MSTQEQNVELVGEAVASNLVRMAMFAALTGAFAYVSFQNPISPVPVTLQVLGVFLAGVFLGPLWGGASMLVYVATGAMGAPIFAGGSAGLGVLLGPYGGYLWSYPFAAAALGLVVHGVDGLNTPKEVGLARLVAGMVAATAIIYAFGTVGYAFVNGVGLYEAFLVAAAAFVPVEALKMAAAVGIVRSDAIAAE
ncbi:biotin transporter BioY [Halomarina salina]|uniref:Biotin transporter BioY n=1 Tax=Halomarina salina TaxID=1872699 RepID=A0ABD5RNG3_9EURY|nr:biotin transporter BioY [Halomarina salina]